MAIASHSASQSASQRRRWHQQQQHERINYLRCDDYKHNYSSTMRHTLYERTIFSVRLLGSIHLCALYIRANGRHSKRDNTEYNMYTCRRVSEKKPRRRRLCVDLPFLCVYQLCVRTFLSMTDDSEASNARNISTLYSSPHSASHTYGRALATMFKTKIRSVLFWAYIATIVFHLKKQTSTFWFFLFALSSCVRARRAHRVTSKNSKTRATQPPTTTMTSKKDNKWFEIT